MSKLYSQHSETLEKAMDACEQRYSWTAYPESPSSKIHGAEKPRAGKARFDDVSLTVVDPRDTKEEASVVTVTSPVSGSSIDGIVDYRVIPNGIELSEFTPGRWEDRTPEPTLLYLGRLKRYKGVDLILRAVARLSEMNVACRLRVAGTGWKAARAPRECCLMPE